jgi:biotin carboxylase
MEETAQGQRVLVLGDYRQTVTVVRSLARAGYEVTLGTDDPASSTARSRYLADIWLYESSSTERFHRDLEAYLKSERPAFVFPVGESQLRRMVRAAPRFLRLATWASPDPPTVARCFDKRALYGLTAQLGIPTLPWRQFTDLDDWRAAALEMGLPVIIKRKGPSGQLARKRKAVICRSTAQLDAFLAEVCSDPDPASLVLQKFAAGQRHSCHIAAANGELLAYFQHKVLRTDELDGTGIGTAGVSVAPCPVLRGYCERLLRALDYSGIGCTQFMVDERSGHAAFLELDPRMDSTALLPYRLGYDFPLLAIRLAACRKTGAAAAPLDAPYPHGKKYRYLAWDLRDPLPTLHQFWKRFCRPLLRRFQPSALRHV